MRSIVGHTEFHGIAEEGDFVHRIRCDFREGPQNPVPLDGEQRLRQAHVHENARARLIDTGQYHGVKKLPCLVGGFPVEQLRPEKTVFVGDAVFHGPKN